MPLADLSTLDILWIALSAFLVVVGLGLALVKQIAAAHGGSVGCEAREGGGSRFWVRLPAAAVVQTAAPARLDDQSLRPSTTG